MALKAFEIPLSAQAQRFTVDLLDVTYNMALSWNSNSASWTLDILDVGNNPLVLGCPLVTGMDLLAQYEYLGIGGPLIVMSDSNSDNVPTFDNLGDASHLYFVTGP